MMLPNRSLLPAGEREDEWGPELIRPWLSMPSWDPETETTASRRDFWNNRLATRPSSGRGRDALTLSQSSSLSLWVFRPKASCSSAHCQLTGARMGGAACLRLAQWHRFWRLLRMQCGSRGGRKGPPSATSRMAAETGRWWRQQLPAKAGCVGSPQSANVQPGTAGPCYRLRRRRGQSGIQEPWGTKLLWHMKFRNKVYKLSSGGARQILRLISTGGTQSR